MESFLNYPCYFFAYYSMYLFFEQLIVSHHLPSWYWSPPLPPQTNKVMSSQLALKASSEMDNDTTQNKICQKFKSTRQNKQAFTHFVLEFVKRFDLWSKMEKQWQSEEVACVNKCMGFWEGGERREREEGELEDASTWMTYGLKEQGPIWHWCDMG